MACLLAFFGVWMALGALAVWAWHATFAERIDLKSLSELWVGIGSVLSVVYGRYGPLPPMGGRPPEELAADLFFERPGAELDEGLRRMSGSPPIANGEADAN